MAYATRELFDDNSSSVNPSKRVVPKSIVPKTFAAVGAAPTYKKGTPVTYDTSVSKWKVWDSDGANGTDLIKGFLWPLDATMDAANDVLASVMMAGEIQFADIEIPSGEISADLATACKVGPRALGLDIKGLVNVH